MLSLGACVVGQTNQIFYAELKPLNDNFTEKALEVSGLSMEQLKIKGEKPTDVFLFLPRLLRKQAGVGFLRDRNRRDKYA